MANYPIKMTDPTEAALSAIQEALNVHEQDEPTPSPAAATPDLFTAPAESAVQIADVAGKEQSDNAPSAGEVADLAGRAANDDQQSIGQILHALQRRPARSSYYFVAALFSGAWIIGCLGLSLA